jgi:subtilase family serine protease
LIPVIVTFTPSTEGTHVGEMTVTSDDPNEPSLAVPLQGDGVLVPDLMELSLSNPPLAALAGSSFTATDTVKNQGTGSAVASTTRYYVSLDDQWSSGDVLLAGSRPVGSMGSGGLSSGSTSVSIPSFVNTGLYYLLACADDTGQVLESNELNNCRASTTQVLVTKPDLVETSVSNPPSAAPAGSSFPVTDTVTNQGNGSAGPSATRFFLSFDTTKSGGDVPIGGRSVGNLAVNGSSTVTTSVSIPSFVNTGLYYLLACADDTGQVLESNELNNCRASTTQVQLN